MTMSASPFLFKKKTGTSMCPVKGCRHLIGRRKKLCDKHHQSEWRRLHPMESAYAVIRDRAKRKKQVFSLTFEQFSEFVNGTRYLAEKGVTGLALHIDRKDASRGYEPGNLQILTCSENSAKGNRERFVPYLVEKRRREAEEAVQEEPERPYNEFLDYEEDDNQPF